MKTTKIKLENLKVESFVTNLKAEKLNTVQGGRDTAFTRSMTPDPSQAGSCHVCTDERDRW